MPIHLKAKDAKATLEPAVIFPGLPDDEPVHVGDTHIQLSIAISLKRIADTLTSPNIDPSLWESLKTLAWEMGGNFGHGLRQNR